jgi:alpha-1,3-rhamnosyltransferase
MKDKLNSQPLVSIILVAYNSSEFIIETLESIKRQTYENIELIISDDASNDKTFEICQSWISRNQKRFVMTELIAAKKNTGIHANCNRGAKKANGSWLKFIAGDDILLDEAISKGVNYINLKVDTLIFASNVIKFKSNYNSITNETTALQNNTFFKLETSTIQQFQQILIHNPIFAPSVFLSRKLFDLNEGFDESISYMEDYPFWIKTLQNGVHIDFLPETTVAYRLSEGSVSGHNSQKIFNSFYTLHFKFQKKYTFKYLNYKNRFNQTYIYVIKKIFDYLNINNKKFRIFYKLCLKINIFNIKNLK